MSSTLLSTQFPRREDKKFNKYFLAYTFMLTTNLKSGYHKKSKINPRKALFHFQTVHIRLGCRLINFFCFKGFKIRKLEWLSLKTAPEIVLNVFVGALWRF